MGSRLQRGLLAVVGRREPRECALRPRVTLLSHVPLPGLERVGYRYSHKSRVAAAGEHDIHDMVQRPVVLFQCRAGFSVAHGEGVGIHRGPYGDLWTNN